MRKILSGTASLLFLTATAFSQPDPRDSVILESKAVAPQIGPTAGQPTMRVRMDITNKDSLTGWVLSLEEKTLSNGAFATLGRSAGGTGGRNFNSVISLLPHPTKGVVTLGSPAPLNVNGYHSDSPDSFATGGFFTAGDDESKEPPNAVRRALLEIKFDSVTTQAIGGQFILDSIRILANRTGFSRSPVGARVDVNFVPGVITVGLPFQLNLVAPHNQALVLERRPTFIWESLRDTLPVSARYTVFLATNPGFSPADTSPPLTDTLWQVPTDLQFETTYHWKVRAITDQPDTIFSLESRSFRIDAPPSAPLDLYPSSGADISVNDYLVWLEGGDPDAGDNVTYQVQIDDNPNFSSPEVDQGGIDENTQPLSRQFASSLAAGGNALAVQLKTFSQNDNLKDDSLYYWRVRTVDNHGLGSAYTSGTRNFYLNLADSSPRPVTDGFTPAGGVVLTIHRPNFSWFPTFDPDPADPPSSLRYNVRLDTDGEALIDFQFAFSTAPGETNFTTLDSLSENGHWFWAVRAIDSKGARSPFSTIQDFYVNAQNEPPASFSLLSPPNGGSVVTKAPVLDWEDAADPDPLDLISYTGMISSDSTFATGFAFGPLGGSSHQVGSGLLSRGIDYFWRVSASDTAGANTPSSQVFKFRIQKLGDLDGDGDLTAADIVLLLNFVFLGEPPVDPPELADLDCDGEATSIDVVLALNAVFLGQPLPCDP